MSGTIRRKVWPVLVSLKGQKEALQDSVHETREQALERVSEIVEHLESGKKMIGLVGGTDYKLTSLITGARVSDLVAQLDDGTTYGGLFAHIPTQEDIQPALGDVGQATITEIAENLVEINTQETETVADDVEVVQEETSPVIDFSYDSETEETEEQEEIKHTATTNAGTELEMSTEEIKSVVDDVLGTEENNDTPILWETDPLWG